MIYSALRGMLDRTGGAIRFLAALMINLWAYRPQPGWLAGLDDLGRSHRLHARSQVSPCGGLAIRRRRLVLLRLYPRLHPDAARHREPDRILGDSGIHHQLRRIGSISGRVPLVSAPGRCLPRRAHRPPPKLSFTTRPEQLIGPDWRPSP